MIIISLMEKFGDEKFRIFWSNSTGFFVKFNDSGHFNIRYEDYILDRYTLLFSTEFLDKKIGYKFGKFKFILYNCIQ
jgi:hypothetical protein